MTSLQNIVSSILLHMVILLIVMFDPSGTALGATFVSLPNWATTVFDLLGNFLWLPSTIFLIAGIVLFFLAMSEDIVATAAKKPLDRVTIWHKTIRTLAIINGAFATASGFWFTGPALLISVVGVWTWRIEVENQVKKQQLTG